MIRVLNILQVIGSGGVERRRLSLSKLLDKEKFQLKIICTETIGDFANEIINNNVEVISVGALRHPFDLKVHRRVQQVISDYRPHIIHGAVFEGVTMAAINGFYKRVPIIILEETSDPQNRSWRGNLLMKLFSLTADKVIGVSPASTSYLTEKLKIRPDKIKLINNGVPLPSLKDAKEIVKLKSDILITEDDIVIGSVGRMVSDEHKRFSDLIKAVATLVSEGLQVKLILVGEGSERVEYQNLAKDLGIENSVIFTGYSNNVALYYSIFDVFALVSAYESFGLVLAEAMLYKLPVLATKVGGMKFIVDQGETGFLVERYNVSEIADNLRKLVLNQELRKRMGERGYLKAKKEYTEDRYVKEVAELYEFLCHKKKLL